MTQINPLEVSSALRKRYSKYISGLVRPRERTVADALLRAINQATHSQNNLVKGPYLEAQPGYVKATTIRDLVAEGILSHEFLKFTNDTLPIDRSLYSHQVKSIRRVTSGNNVIVATGTGSGKTESFLLPIIDSLFKEKEEGKLGAGVRALLLYPMNALANDQVKRLRKLLANTPEITFGRYTGETEKTYEKALEKYIEFEGHEPLPNELISRKQMQDTPPNILLTNFAMLEYLLLRPADTALFEGASTGTWRFIVADEAHTYDGAHGVEVAILLKKLRERVDRDGRVQTIGTTATIGEDNEAIRKFAESFFGNSFDIDSPNSPDLITPERESIPEPLWGPIAMNEWIEINRGEKRFQDLASFSKFGNDFEALSSESSFVTLRKHLSNGPTSVPDAAVAIYGVDGELERAALLAMVELGSRIKDQNGEPCLSARFHLFARATEGVFSCLNEEPHVSLYRHESCEDCGCPVLEMAGCKKCGAVYYTGKYTSKGNSHFVTPKGQGRDAFVFAYDVAIEEPAEDEIFDEDIVDVDGLNKAIHLCTGCGRASNEAVSECASCGSTNIRQMLIKEGRAESETSCKQCQNHGRNIIRKLDSGVDAAASVLATELYLNMPPEESDSAKYLPGQGRKLMVFSDSRQQAAFFAPYLEDSYSKILWRKLLRSAVARSEAVSNLEPWRAKDVVDSAIKIANESLLFGDSTSVHEKVKLIHTQMHLEAVSSDTQMNLEGTGTLKWSMALPTSDSAYEPFSAIGLNKTDFQALLQVLFWSLRNQGALSSNDLVNEVIELYAPRTGPIFVRKTGGTDRRSKTISWLPSGKSNRHLSFIRRVVAKLGISAEPTALLEQIWSQVLVNPSSPFKSLMVAVPNQIHGIRYRLNFDLLQVETTHPETQIFECDICRTRTHFNVGGVCVRNECSGTLIGHQIGDSLEESHYSSIYLDDSILLMKAREHTAQLTSEMARKVQTEFINGEVNVLSSSTTFELGVDVGELNSVLLRNMPPSTANYLQRAGRAGRRSDSAALILTYAQRRPHDLSRFANPLKMIAGEMRAPYVNLDNYRILIRHIYSLFFATYWQTSAGTFKDAETFFLENESGTRAVDDFKAWIVKHQDVLFEKYQFVLPTELKSMERALWRQILEALPDLLDRVTEKLTSEVNEYQSLIDALLVEFNEKVSSGQKADAISGKINRLNRVVNTIKSRDIIGFMSTQNLLPKYGFPVDTVNLQPRYTDANAENIDMSRDLSVAIFEYAPGNKLVASGYLWESVGLTMMPGKELEMFKYSVCNDCGHFNRAIADSTDSLSECANCGQSLPKAKTYIWPKWGFVSNGGERKPGDSAPKAAWNRSLYLAEDGEKLSSELEVPSPRVKAELQTIAKLLVVNNGTNGQGFQICPTCRAAFPSDKSAGNEHYLPFAEKKCGKTFVDKNIQLGHQFETDLVKVSIDYNDSEIDASKVGLSVQYAILEAAAEELQISHDDIDVVPLGTKSGVVTFAIVDAVPAGAGFAKLVAEALPMLFKAALKKVSNCECGVETSCYECLRGYSNQRVHDELSRQDAIDGLSALTSKGH